LHRFIEGFRQLADAAGGELIGREFVEVFLLRRAGVEVLADAFESGGEHQGGGEIRVAGGVGIAAFKAAASHRHAHGVGAVVAAITVENRCPRVVGHQALADEALVGIHGGGEGGAERGTVFQDPGDELIGELAHAEASRVVGVRAFEKIRAVCQIVERHVEMRAAAGAVGEGLGHEGG